MQGNVGRPKIREHHLQKMNTYPLQFRPSRGLRADTTHTAHPWPRQGR